MSESDKYKEVINANIELHAKLSAHYNSCEPHFRQENVKKVEQKLSDIIRSVNGKKMLDLGCGTGFMINIAKKYADEITGVDVTQAMLDKVDLSGTCKISLINGDTGTVKPEKNSYDVVTAYSFLHHLYEIDATLRTACDSLRQGGKFYADLEPNFLFWEQIKKLKREGTYDPIVKREIEAVAFKDEDIEKNFGVKKHIFNNAEFGKNIAGGFKEEELRSKLFAAGFTSVEFFYHWYIGQGILINDEKINKEERNRSAEIMNDILQRSMPLSKNLFKYIGFIAVK